MGATSISLAHLAKDLTTTPFFHELVTEALAQRDWSRADLSRHSGIDEGTLSRLLGTSSAPTRRPRIQHVAAVANAFADGRKPVAAWLEELNRSATKTLMEWDQLAA